jgi:hypothetical protein
LIERAFSFVRFPIQPLNVVPDDELGAVLTVLQTTDFLLTGAREDAYPVVEDAVHRLPILVALKRGFGARGRRSSCILGGRKITLTKEGQDVGRIPMQNQIVLLAQRLA